MAIRLREAIESLEQEDRDDILRVVGVIAHKLRLQEGEALQLGIGEVPNRDPDEAVDFS